MPQKGDTVVFFFRKKDKVVLYFMITLAVGECDVSRYVGIENVAYVDGCGPYIFTDIKNPIVVDLKDIIIPKI